MSDNKKYYYLKLKDNFFDSEEIKILESMDNGYKYSNILLKMSLKSLKREGLLVFKEKIPYSPEMIATITNHNVNDVRMALELFKEMNLIEILDNGAIFMMDIQNYIGKSTTEADRIRLYRNKVDLKIKELTEGNETVMLGLTISEENNQLGIRLNDELELEPIKESIEKIPYTEIKDAYNNILGVKEKMSSIRSITSKRKKPVKARWDNDGLNKIEKWTELFNKVLETPFVCGVNDRGWAADFDWLIANDTNFIKVLEGKYGKAKKKNTSNKVIYNSIPDNF